MDTPPLRCMHMRTQVWTHMCAQLLHPPPGSSNSSSCFSGLGSRSSRRASHVSSLTGTSTNTAAAAKEGFKLPGLKRRPLNSGEMVELDASGYMNRSEGKEPELGFLHLKCFAPVVDSHILIFQDSAQVSPLSEAFLTG